MSETALRAAPASTADRRWERIVRDSGLPPELAALTTDLVRRTRLWRSERSDVARELVAHFADGLRAGVSATELAVGFGDPRMAARLLTRARRRLRPAWYRGWVWARNTAAGALALLLIVYAWLAARYYIGQPRITRNYAAEFSQQAGTSPSDCAWPIYLQAIRSLGPGPEFLKQDDFPSRAGEPHWADAVAYLRSHAEGLALVRAAAAKPVIGVAYRNTSDPALMEAMQARSAFEYTPQPVAKESNPFLVGMLLPHLGEMRRNARLLRFDAREAVVAGDGPRFLADVEALLGISSQAWAEPFLISDLVSLAVLSLASDLLLETLPAGMLSAEQLRGIAHRLAASPAPSLELDFAAEQAIYEDFMQRFYSDNGRGNGHTVYASLPEIHREFGTPDPSARVLVKALLPALTVVQPSRAQFRRLVLEAAAAAEHDQSLPLWRRFERTGDVARERLKKAMTAVFPPMGSLLGTSGLGGMLISRDLTAMRRDAALVALALECHRASHGRYPDALDELVPGFLPRVPLDGADGRPLRYRLQDGRPQLYSLGCDGDEDGGRTPPLRRGGGNAERFGPAIARPENNKPESAPSVLAEIDGDWILYSPRGPGE